MKKIIKVCIVLSWILSFPVEAFEKQELKFSMATDKKPDVAFVFTGLILEAPLDILKKGQIKDQELRRIHSFFQKLYEANKNGTKKEVLAVWSPEERQDLDKSIDAKSAEQNKARFQSLSGMELKMIIEYADYYICYLKMTFEGEKSFVMKFPVKIIKEELYLTNKLNGDYFYDNISHLLDKSHFEIKMQ